MTPPPNDEHAREDLAFLMTSGVSFWKAQFDDPDEAAEALSRASDSRLRVEPSRLDPYSLDVTLASDGGAIVANGVNSRHQLLVDDSPRCLGIRWVWKGGVGLAHRRDVALVKAGQGTVFDTTRITMHMSEPSSLDTVVLIPFDRLVESARRLTDRPLLDGWPGARVFTSEDRLGSGIEALVRAAASTLDLTSPDDPKPGYALRRIHEALGMFLVEHAGLCGDPGDDDAVPLPSLAQVQRALDIIEAMTEPLTVLELAGLLNVSVRTLQFAFRKHFGTLPHAAIKRARLRQARLLIESGTVATVKEACHRLGFSNAARFADEFRAAFGESPIAILHRARDG